MRIYKINARVRGKSSPEPSIPFQHFFLVPDVPYEQLKKLSPYALLLPLKEAYDRALEKRGLSCPYLTGQGYKVLVPIHMERAPQDYRQLQPAYVVGGSWKYLRKGTDRALKLKDFFTEEAALVTPERLIQPLSLACQNHLDHVTGECQMGTYDCNKSIRIDFTPVTPDDDPKEAENVHV